MIVFLLKTKTEQFSQLLLSTCSRVLNICARLEKLFRIVFYGQFFSFSACSSTGQDECIILYGDSQVISSQMHEKLKQSK